MEAGSWSAVQLTHVSEKVSSHNPAATIKAEQIVRNGDECSVDYGYLDRYKKEANADPITI